MNGSKFLLILLLLFLSGCETLNDALVRQMMKEPGLSGSVLNRIREGLEKREGAPAAAEPRRYAPAFMDQG